MNKIIWNNEAREFTKNLDGRIRREIGTLLMMLQQGVVLGMPQSRPMRVIHKNAHELRVRDRDGTYRVIYVIVERGKIVIPHAFTKKSRTTPQKEIDLSIKRLKVLLDEIK